MLRWFNEPAGLETREHAVARAAVHVGPWMVWDGRGDKIENYAHVASVSKEKIKNRRPWPGWPLPNVWLGVSCEDQKTADERIPLLLQTPAAARFVSLEPLLGAVDLSVNVRPMMRHHLRLDVEGALRNRAFDSLQDDGQPLSRREAEDALFDLHAKGVKFIPVGDKCEGFTPEEGCPGHRNPFLDWVIVGGESGPKCRPMDLDWARSIRDQCKAAGVPFFMKQLGGWPDARKQFDQLPDDLQIRDFPTT